MSSSLTKKQKLILLVIACVLVIGGLMGAIIYGVNQVQKSVVICEMHFWSRKQSKMTFFWHYLH